MSCKICRCPCKNYKVFTEETAKLWEAEGQYRDLKAEHYYIAKKLCQGCLHEREYHKIEMPIVK